MVKVWKSCLETFRNAKYRDELVSIIMYVRLYVYANASPIHLGVEFVNMCSVITNQDMKKELSTRLW